MNGFKEAPRPNYDYDVKRLVKQYERSLKDIQSELNSLFLTDFERAQIVAVEENIRKILKDLRRFGDGWAKETIPKAAREGVASTIYSLDLTPTFSEALKIAKFNGLNKELVEAIVADTQSDLLAVTENVSRRTRSTVRKVTSEVMRSKSTAGVNGIQSLKESITKNLRKQLGSAADTAIIDAAGRRWKLGTYTEMLARTKSMEAHKESSINEALGRGVEYGVISRHGATDACAKWEGRIIALSPDGDGQFPYVGDLPRDEIFHPNCKHLISPVRRPDRLPEDLRELNDV